MQDVCILYHIRMEYQHLYSIVICKTILNYGFRGIRGYRELTWD